MQEKREPLLDVVTIDQLQEQFNEQFKEQYKEQFKEQLKEQLNSPETLKKREVIFLWWLFQQDKGLAALANEPHFLNQDNLNSAPTRGDNEGVTVLYILASNPEGREILAKHPQLLTQGNLKAGPKNGPASGRTVLWYLTATVEGLKILEMHPELLRKGDLNAAAKEGSEAGKTPLWWLASKSMGHQVLAKNPDVLYQGNLNAVATQDTDAGKSVLWLLAGTPFGRKILMEKTILLIDADFSAAPKEGLYAGRTVRDLLQNTPEGKQLLAHCAEQQRTHQHKLISNSSAPYPEKEQVLSPKRTSSGFDNLENTPEGKLLLTHFAKHQYVYEPGIMPYSEKEQVLPQIRISSDDNYPNTSAQDNGLLNQDRFNSAEKKIDFALAKTPEDRIILAHLTDLLNQEHLDSASEKILLSLAQTILGRLILAQCTDLLKPEHLNAASHEGSVAGITVLWYFACTSNGRQILADHPELLRIGNISATPEQDPHAGESVLWMLASTSEGQRILAANPDLLTPENTNTAPAYGPNEGKTVLWSLSRTPEGRRILALNPQLLRQGNLDATAKYGNARGITVLGFLAGSSDGQDILANFPELLSKGDLNAAPEEGLYAGITILWCLASKVKGREILGRHPELLTSGNLDAAPKEGPNAGITVRDLLGKMAEKKQFVHQHPQELISLQQQASQSNRSSEPYGTDYYENNGLEQEAISPMHLEASPLDAEQEQSLSKKRKRNDFNAIYANNNDKGKEKEPPLKRFQAGIAPKYLGGIAPAKMPLKPSRKADVPAMHELTFIPVHCIRAAAASPLHTHPLNSTSWGGYVLSRHKEFTPQQITTFVCAGRTANALIPQSQCALICTEDELEQVLPHLSDTVDILVITKLNSQYNGDYKDHLGSITARRLAAFLFAFKYDLQRFILLDDNIQKVLVNTNNQTTGSWPQFFNALSTQLGEQASISVATRNGRPKAANELGSKLFMINMERIRKLIWQEEYLFLLFPDATQARKWGEDYYFQMFLDYLFQRYNQAGFGIVPVREMSLLRSKQHRNAFKARGTQATAFAMTEALEPLPSALRPLVYNTIHSLNDLISDNQERQERYEQFQRRFNLRRLHAAVNNTGPTAVTGNSPILKGRDFKTNFYNLINQYDYSQSILRDYQIEAIKAVLTRYQFPSRYLLATGSGKTLIQNTLALMACHAAMDNQSVFIVTPQIELVNQLYRDLINYNDSLRDRQDPLCVSNDAILKVSSHEQSIALKLFLKNESVKNASSIVICCADSFKNLLAEDPKLVESAALVLFDEYHVYQPLMQNVCDSISEQGPITIASSATPPKHDRIHNTLYTLSLKEALNGPYHAPVVACSLNVNYSKKNAKNFLRCLPEFLKRQYHPGIEEEGRTLAETKGIIYVQNIKVCNQVANLLEKAHIKAYAIHSKNRDAGADVREFVDSEEPGVLIAVRKLRFGFDCPDLAWEIIARKPNKKQPEHDVEQMLGRIVRSYGNSLALVFSFQDIHEQYVLPLIKEQNKAIKISPDYLAHEMEYYLLNNGECVAVDPDWELMSFSAPEPDALVPDAGDAPPPDSGLDEEENEKEKENHVMVDHVPIKPIRAPQTRSFFASEPQVTSPIKPTRTTESLYELIATQNEPGLVAFLPPALKTDNAAASAAPRSFFNQSRPLSPGSLMVHEFFTQVPQLQLKQLIQCAEGKYFAHLLKACPRAERNKLILSGAFDSLWMNLDLNELYTLINELKIYRSSYALAHLVNRLFIRHHDRYGEENGEIIPQLHSYFIKKCTFFMETNPHHKRCTKEAIDYMGSLLEKVNQRFNLEVDSESLSEGSQLN